MRKRICGICLTGLIGVSMVTGCGNRAENPEVLTESRDREEMVLRVHESLYYGTDETGPMGDSGCVEGYIRSSVSSDEIPSENGVSNFSCVGNPYTFDDGSGMIMVSTDDETWHCFYKKE